MAEKLKSVKAEVFKVINHDRWLRLEDGRFARFVLPGYEATNVKCWVDNKGNIEEVTYEDNYGKLYSINQRDSEKHYTKTNFENKHLFTPGGKEVATRLEELPPLKEGFIRLKHRCMSESVGMILNAGLVFNRGVAKVNVGGACYTDITAMASYYENSDEFWNSMKKDDFACFDNSRYADTQVIMDMPIEEFEFLESYGRFVHGRVDNKYIVGVVRNYNGSNKDLVMPEAEVEKAREQSEHNEEINVDANDIKLMRSVMAWRRRNR